MLYVYIEMSAYNIICLYRYEKKSCQCLNNSPLIYRYANI